MKTFNVGELVKVVDRGEIYSSYEKVIRSVCPNLLSAWAKKETPGNNDVCFVVAEYSNLEERLYVVRNASNWRVFIISPKGIESLDKPQPKRKFTEDQINEAKSVVGGILATYFLEDRRVFFNANQSSVVTRVSISGKNGIARRNPNDEFNKHIGFMVALCRASNNENMIPSWVYGK